ncbi:hypothetical protein KR074_005987 [Drosophila pseudoananassae]|nr:hypothetical protein KR074_005987 [Drosophila pseudoananassae]
MANQLPASEGPIAGVKPHLQPWEVIAWTPAQLTRMYSDWAIYLTRNRRLRHGLHCVDNALKLDPVNTKALMRRSQIQRKMGLAAEALKDCAWAEALLKKQVTPVSKTHVSLEVCDALYEANRLEDTKIKLHDHLRLFSSAQGVSVVNRLNVVDGNFRDTLSEETTLAVQRLINRMLISLAKEPKEIKGDCDVVSIIEKEETVLSPLEIARRKRHYKIYNQTYLNKCWMDVEFLKKLRSDQKVHPKHSESSSKYLCKLIDNNYKMVRSMTKMLHTRCPMYAQHQQKYPNTALWTKQKEENLYRIQYQTRRNMFKILRSIRQLIRVGDLRKLSNFIEEVMGDYTTIKTNRVMPWKFEFINEVYNYLGLARLNEFKIPSNMTVLQGKQRLLTLFKLPVEKNLELQSKKPKQPGPLYLARSDLTDPKTEKFKKKVARYEKRMLFAEYPIERAYLLHELAQSHLDNNSFDPACSLARKALEEATRCKSIVWSFLSLMVICKAHAILGKIEREKDTLSKAFELAKRMKNMELCLFIDICIKVNAEEMDLKRLVSSDMSTRRQRSRQAPLDPSSADRNNNI